MIAVPVPPFSQVFENRTLPYAEQCPIPMRMEMSPKFCPCSSQQFDQTLVPNRVQKWLVTSPIAQRSDSEITLTLGTRYYDKHPVFCVTYIVMFSDILCPIFCVQILDNSNVHQLIRGRSGGLGVTDAHQSVSEVLTF
jgi:hypothetical protein